METIRLDREDRVAVITLNRPDVLNAIDRQMIDELRETLASLKEDAGIGALVITGAGRGFSAGADLAANDPRPEGLSTGEGVAWGMETGFNPLARDIAHFPKPILAAVNGTAAGGGVGLALSCDIVVAARSASFIQVFGPRLGLVPDVGCTWYLPHLVGRARARGLALLGDKLPAEQAADWGLIWECVDDNALMGRAMELAGRLAAGPVNAFAEIKRTLDQALDNDLDTQLDLERDTQGKLGDHPNFAEGVTAFLQKREPNFSTD